jgi:hypothetical protein
MNPRDENKRKLILIQLNEINFDLVRQYTKFRPGKFPSLEQLLSGTFIRTSAEANYQQLEPWIQWVSVHTGLTYDEHAVFRLGDIVGTDIPQFFEQVEEKGFRVGAVSPMNAENRLKAAAYFLPDPWTETPASGSWLVKGLSKAISQAVNDNSNAKISYRSAFFLIIALVYCSRPKNLFAYFRLALASLGAPWRKALFLDILLNDLHLYLLKKNNPDLSVLFLNAGAHIQHHYLLNSKVLEVPSSATNPSWYISPSADPVEEMLVVYDSVLGDYLGKSGVELIIATGLSQRAYDKVKYYYRLSDHVKFLDRLAVKYKKVLPRMTRDFLIEFENAEDARVACNVLSEIHVTPDGIALFGEIDCRGTSVFVTLTYPNKIDDGACIVINDKPVPLMSELTFVAIKNGMHQSHGYAFFTGGVAGFAPADGAHVRNLHASVMKFFGGQCS